VIDHVFRESERESRVVVETRYVKAWCHEILDDIQYEIKCIDNFIRSGQELG
jgi:hypothetical protein